jgi:hypothetical protein
VKGGNYKVKKIILILASFLLIGVFAVSVSAGEDIEFTAPTEGQHIKEDFPVEWKNNDSTPGVFLQYKGTEGDWIDLQRNMPGEQRNYLWETGSLPDGSYWLRLRQDIIHDVISLKIDNTNPEASILVLQPGFENDWLTQDSKTIVDLDVSDNLEVAFCEINWGDGSDPEGCLGDGDNFEHQYLDNGNYEIFLTVKDRAGNEVSDDATAEVENVAPVCNEILLNGDIVTGRPVGFLGNATDVRADLPLSYFWEFGDGEEDTGNPVNHVYEEAGPYTVELTVTDDEEAEGVCVKEIEVLSSTTLDSQEVAAYYNLEANFGENSGKAEHSFATGLEGEIACDKIQGPENLNVSANGQDCVVKWGDPEDRASNDERGEHDVIVKARELQENGENFAYFDFDVTVYSWIIPLHEGWNLVSIPLVPEDSNLIEDVILNQIFDDLPGGTEYAVWSYQYNPDTKESVWLRTRRSGFGDLDIVSAGNGFWIKVVRDTEIKGFGVQGTKGPDGQPGPPPLITIPTSDWSLIGRYGIINQVEPKKAGELAKEIALKSVMRERSKNELRVLAADEERGFVPVDSLANNMGFWLFVDNNRNNDALEEPYTPIDEFYHKN